MIKRILIVAVVFFGALSIFMWQGCNRQTEEDDDLGIIKQPLVVDNTISTDFGTNTFSSGVEAKLLKELKICNPKAVSDTSELDPACSPKFFRFFKLAKNIKLNDGFMLLVKAGVNGFPLRRLLVFERENGNLVKLNGFNGNLIERRNSATGYDDLIIRFADNQDGMLIYFNCLFQWENGRYEYKYCEEIDENGPARIKAEFRDSMGVEIKKILDKNNMLF